jgi:hypothetical protein
VSGRAAGGGREHNTGGLLAERGARSGGGGREQNFLLLLLPLLRWQRARRGGGGLARCRKTALGCRCSTLASLLLRQLTAPSRLADHAASPKLQLLLLLTGLTKRPTYTQCERAHLGDLGDAGHGSGAPGDGAVRIAQVASPGGGGNALALNAACTPGGERARSTPVSAGRVCCQAAEPGLAGARRGQLGGGRVGAKPQRSDTVKVVRLI